MANRYLLALFLLSLTMSTVVCQTFQYSHGWTNGKRSAAWSFEEFIDSLSKNAAQTTLFNCQIQKLRLLLQGSVNDQFLQVPCVLQNRPKRSYTENVNTSGQLD